MRKIIDIVFLILYLQTGWLSIYAVDYISSDYHCIIFHKKLCNCILFPDYLKCNWCILVYLFLLRIYSWVYDIEIMMIYQKYKLYANVPTKISYFCFHYLKSFKWYQVKYFYGYFFTSCSSLLDIWKSNVQLASLHFNCFKLLNFEIVFTSEAWMCDSINRA